MSWLFLYFGLITDLGLNHISIWQVLPVKMKEDASKLVFDCILLYLDHPAFREMKYGIKENCRWFLYIWITKNIYIWGLFLWGCHVVRHELLWTYDMSTYSRTTWGCIVVRHYIWCLLGCLFPACFLNQNECVVNSCEWGVNCCKRGWTSNTTAPKWLHGTIAAFQLWKMMG